MCCGGVTNGSQVRYNDNYLNWPEHDPEHVFTIGYEEQFMQMVGYDETFIRPQSVLSPKACDAQHHPSQGGGGGDHNSHNGFYLLLAQLVGGTALLLVGLALGVRIGVRRATAAAAAAEEQEEGSVYQPLNGAAEDA